MHKLVYFKNGFAMLRQSPLLCFISILQCYTLMTSLKPVTFKYANDECESVRGSLISISDQVEQGG